MHPRTLFSAALAATLGLAAPVVAARLILESTTDICAVDENDTLTIQISMADLGADEAAGFQAFIEFDAGRLVFDSGSYTAAPFGLWIQDPIADDGGFIELASGVDRLNGQNPTSADALLVELNFTVQAGMGQPAIGFVNHVPPIRLTDDQGNEIAPLLEGFAPPSCPPDISGNGEVEITDLIILLSNWDNECPGDLVVDGVVNIVDLVELLTQWGPCPTPV